MTFKPIRKSLGLLLVSDGIRAFIAPEAYVRSLQRGNPLIDDILDYLGGNRRLMLRFSVIEMVVGLWLTLG